MKRPFRRLLCTVLLLCRVFVFLPAATGETDLVKLQERLLSLGYEIGTADGVTGPKTAAAVLLAQTLLADAGYDIRPTGQPDTRTAELIMQEQNKELLRTLLRGSWGTRVSAAQRKLVGLNLLRDSVDGTFGANTEAAVIAFEEQMEARRKAHG